MLEKHKAIRLHGDKLNKLNERVWTRDEGCCVICGSCVPWGTKMHHEPQGANKQDKEECALLLCNKCHSERHFGSNSKIYKEKCKEYLMKVIQSGCC